MRLIFLLPRHLVGSFVRFGVVVIWRGRMAQFLMHMFGVGKIFNVGNFGWGGFECWRFQGWLVSINFPSNFPSHLKN